MDREKLANLLFPNALLTIADIEAKYPKRVLQEGAKVTRMAPSPTGFMHLGNLLAATAAERLAHQSGGVFYLRIEDTDQKREVEGGVQAILDAFSAYNLHFDEGATVDGDNGAYAPYRQRARAELYQAYAKVLVQEGLAYPCFCSEAALSEAHAKQEAEKANFGYYGKWAAHRDMPLADIEAELQKSTPFVLRFRSEGDSEKKLPFTDLVKGTMELPENNMDIVLLKSDGIPTYHFAHIIDDTLMGTTHVVRGDEWLATLPVHLQLFKALALTPPKYLHIAPLMKQDGESKRKLSKRKDPELSLSYYAAEGYPVLAVMEYLLTLLNSNFEEWRMANPAASYTDFPFSPKKMSASGALFDLSKLRDISKTVLSRLTADEVYALLLEYSKAHDDELFALLSGDAAYAKAILSIGRGGEKPRKDFVALSEVKGYLSFFYEQLFAPEQSYPESISAAERKALLADLLQGYDEGDEQSVWFDKMKDVARKHGFADNTKEYKKNPEGFKGHIGDVSMVLRVAVCGRQNAPDLHASMQILGHERITKRIEEAMLHV